MAASSLTFSRLPLAEALAAVAGLGFAAVEIAAHAGWAHLSPADLAEDEAGVGGAVAAAVSAARLRVVAMNAGLPSSDVATQVVWVGALARLCATLGGRVLTVPAAAPPRDAVVQAAGAEVRRLEALVAAASASGVRLAVECHIGALTEEPATAAALCRAVPGLGLTLDPSHYWAGGAQGRGWEAVVPHVYHVHLRDAGLGGWPEIQMSVGRGCVDFPAVIAALRAAGYAGDYAEEYIDSIPVAGGGSAPEQALAIARAAAGWLA